MLQSMGMQRVGHDLPTEQGCTFLLIVLEYQQLSSNQIFLGLDTFSAQGLCVTSQQDLAKKAFTEK